MTSLGVTLTVGLIRGYQRFIPARLKRSCLFVPHCSEYAALALQKYGLLKGASLAVNRIGRCKPDLDCWEDHP